jgi:hypothetical protein
MKSFSVFVACMMLAGAAQATVVYPVSGKLAISDCPSGLLSEDVNINLSSNVQAGIECNASQVAIGTCSISGRTTERTVEQFDCISEPGPNDRFGAATTIQLCTPFDPPQYTTTTGAVIYTGSSAQGTIIPDYAGAACSAAAAETSAQGRLQ